MLTTGQKIAIEKTSASRLATTDLENIKFGRVFSDHMFRMDHTGGEWRTPRIVPFGDMMMSPASLVLHYGQSIFEGLKAYRTDNGEVALFRPEANISRMNRSAERMCMPTIPEDLFLDGLKELVGLDRSWIPEGQDAALYIRPFMFAADKYIGVRPSDDYTFMIFTCPVRGYYKEAVDVKVETFFSRAFPGGTGTAKCAGNYAAALYPAMLAQREGFHQLLWTDGMEHKYVEESGTMNVFFGINGTLITPETSGTILEGVTRDSIIRLARKENIPVEVRRVSVQEVLDAARAGTLKEVFGAGTAATIANVNSLTLDGERFELPSLDDRPLADRIGRMLDDIRRGRVEDTENWLVMVP